MRLKELIISAFGPFKEKQMINFADLYKRKLFLISGPTGAGKTSIFDAICFALFGTSSGSNRDGESLCSDFATVDDETYVSLSFNMKDNDYEIYRSPRQEKRKQRGAGTTIKQPEAILKINNKVTHTGVTEVDNKIKEILGIDYQQFRQIVMLPQGEFRRLLESSSQEREQIFRNIFNTESFLQIQEILKDKTNKVRQTIEEKQKLLDNCLSNIISDENSMLYHSISEVNKDYDNIIILLSEKINCDENDLTKIREKLDLKEQDIYKLTRDIEIGQNLNQKILKKADLVKAKDLLSARKNEIEHSEYRLQKAVDADKIHQIEIALTKLQESISELKVKQKAVLNIKLKLTDTLNNQQLQLEKEKCDYDKLDEYNEKIILLSNQAPLYDEYEKKITTLATKESELIQVTKQVEKTEALLKNYQEEYRKIETKLADYQSINDKISELNSALETKVNQEKLLKQQLTLITDLKVLQELKQKLAISYQEKAQVCKALRLDYDLKLQAYLLGQAGILAQKLKDNNPCPVCGSKSHPNKATLMESVPTLEIINDLKVEVEENEQIVNECYNQLYNTNLTIKTKSDWYNDLTDEIIDVDKLSAVLEVKNKLFKQATSEITIIKQNKAKCKKIIIKQEQLLLEAKALEDKIKVITNDLIESKTLFQTKSSEHQVVKATLEEYKKTLNSNFNDKAALKQEIDNLSKKYNEIKLNYQALTKEIENTQNSLLIQTTQGEGIEERILAANKELDKVKDNFKQEMIIYEFNSLEEYHNYLIDNDPKEALSAEVKKYYDELRFIDKTLYELQNELKDKAMVDLTQLDTIRKKAIDRLNTLRKEETDLLLMVQNNVKLKREINELYKSIKENYDSYEVISDLSKAANGDNPLKLTFERYILAAYFDEIIYAANLRLSDMTNNRYYLCRKEDKGKGRMQQGLDLEVIDNYTSKIRLVKTLSGGESFIASLALALGLADVIQNYSGGIQLNTIFIDEGFGSLDPNSLDNAITTLFKLNNTGRLIGIISHVQELKERINVQLEIIPTRHGSYVKSVY